jgi:hypothetical protein
MLISSVSAAFRFLIPQLDGDFFRKCCISIFDTTTRCLTSLESAASHLLNQQYGLARKESIPLTGMLSFNLLLQVIPRCLESLKQCIIIDFACSVFLNSCCEFFIRSIRPFEPSPRNCFFFLRVIKD